MMFPLADAGQVIGRDVEGIMYTRTHGSAHPRACLISTHIMSNLCNAMQFLVQRHIFNETGCVFRPGHPVVEPCRYRRAQAFGLAASMAALPTTWPISLACSA